MGKYNEQENDRYLLENNLLDMTTWEALTEAEAFSFSLRAAELERSEHVFKDFSEESFQQLHQHLFQDVYAFAGTFRQVELMKGTTRFCPVQHIRSYSADLFRQLQKEPAWNSLEEAASRLAYFKTELNMLHPFREGNGRTIRMFLRAYALSKGVKWDFELMDRSKYLEAMIQAVTDVSALEKLFQETVQSANGDNFQ